MRPWLVSRSLWRLPAHAPGRRGSSGSGRRRAGSGGRGAARPRVPGQIDVPQGALDVHSFFYRSTLEEKIRIIQRYEVDYVMVRADSPLNGTLKHEPAFTTIDTPGKMYSLYAVDHSKLVR